MTFLEKPFVLILIFLFLACLLGWLGLRLDIRLGVGFFRWVGLAVPILVLVALISYAFWLFFKSMDDEDEAEAYAEDWPRQPL